MSAVAKPELRRLLQKQIKKNLIVAIGLGIISGFAYKFLVCDPHKKVHMEFYKDYDADKEFEIMKNKGVFDSCPPGS